MDPLAELKAHPEKATNPEVVEAWLRQAYLKGEQAKKYIVVWEDRHCDPDLTLFSIKEVAIDYAKTIVKENYPEAEESLTEEMKKEGWVYFAYCTDEGNCVFVIEKTPKEN